MIGSFPWAPSYQAVDCASIGEGYNQALVRLTGSFDILLFVHADVRYWGSGRLLCDAMDVAAKEDTGFVGVAGRCSPLTSSGMWWNDKMLRGSVSHDNLHGGVLLTTSYGPYGEVMVLDGVLLMCHRRVFEKIGQWDESLGWHFYDLDITLLAHKAGLKNYAVPLPILHQGLGALTPAWEASRKVFLEKHGI
jgi:GT2 family glycosyltransferase